MLEYSTYKVTEHDPVVGGYMVTLIRRTQDDWEKIEEKVVFSGNLSDCYAYIQLKEKGLL